MRFGLLKNKVQRVFRGTKGSSLAEMLLVILILSLVTGSIAGCVVAVRNSLVKISRVADAEQLLSTAYTVMRSDMQYCRRVTGSGDNPTFVNGNGIEMSYSQTGEIVYSNGSTQPLLNMGGISDQYQVTFDKYTFANGKFVITGLRVVDPEDPDDSIAEVSGDITIRVINQ
jgi:type II secretory pathway pseudopilin PulG